MNDSELTSGYVLGTLSAEGRAEVERRMPHEPELRRAVDEWDARLLPLTRLAEPVEPSPRLWARIQATLHLEQGTTAQGWWNNLRLWRGLSAGGFAIALVLAFMLALQSPPPPSYMVVLVAPQDKAPGWVVQAGADRRLRLIPLGKFELPADKSLQFWTKADDWKGPVSLGLVKAGQSAELRLDNLPPLQDNQLFEITLEPYAGSPLNRPTGPILHIGRAVKVM